MTGSNDSANGWWIDDPRVAWNLNFSWLALIREAVPTYLVVLYFSDEEGWLGLAGVLVVAFPHGGWRQGWRVRTLAAHVRLLYSSQRARHLF